jgi:hypothetical protein
MFKMAAEDAGGSTQSQLHQHVFSPLPEGEGGRRRESSSSSTSHSASCGGGADPLADTHLRGPATAVASSSGGGEYNGGSGAGPPESRHEFVGRASESARAVLQSIPAASASGGAAEAAAAQQPRPHAHGHHYTPSSLFRAASQGVLELLMGGAPIPASPAPPPTADTAATATATAAAAPPLDAVALPPLRLRESPAPAGGGDAAGGTAGSGLHHPLQAHRHSRHSMSLPDLSALVRSAAATAASGAALDDDGGGGGAGGGGGFGAPFTAEDEGRLSAPTPHAAAILSHLPKLG